MGAGASFENPSNGESDLNRYFCHSCRRIFAMSTPPAGMHCPYCQSSFLEEFARRGSARINARDLRIGLSDEQARRLNNAATLLQILEAQLREELNNLQHAFTEAEARKVKPLSRTMLDNLKSTNLTVDMLCDQPSCPVCSEDYVVGEVVTKLPCSHIFHRPCVLPWLETRRTCPICRFELTDSIPTVQELVKLQESDLIEQLKALDITEEAGVKTNMELAHDLHLALIRKREEEDEADTLAAEEEEWRQALEEERAADEALRRQALEARGIDPDSVTTSAIQSMSLRDMPPGGSDEGERERERIGGREIESMGERERERERSEDNERGGERERERESGNMMVARRGSSEMFGRGHSASLSLSLSLLSTIYDIVILSKRERVREIMRERERERETGIIFVIIILRHLRRKKM